MELLLLSIINYETTLITSQPQCRANNGVPSLGTCNQIVVDGSIITLGTAEALFTRMLWNNLSTQGTASTSRNLNSQHSNCFILTESLVFHCKFIIF